MDIIPNGGSKAKGIEKYIEKLGFNRDQVYAFGDGLNDLENRSRWHRYCDGKWP